MGLDKASCAELLSKQRYNPEVLPQLEAYVGEQCAKGSYDLEANLAVLKLYQFHPDKNNVGVVAKILVKALMNLPNTDFLLCTYLIPDRVQELEPIASIATLATLLETCAFRKVWQSLTPLDELVRGVPGFEDALRRFILDTMQITYQSIPEAHLRESLNVGSDAVPKIISERGWTREGALVRVQLNADNTAKPRKLDEGEMLRFDQMSKILASTRT